MGTPWRYGRIVKSGVLGWGTACMCKDQAATAFFNLSGGSESRSMQMKMRRGFPKPSCAGIGHLRKSTADLWLSRETVLWKHALKSYDWTTPSAGMKEISNLDKLIPKLEHTLDKRIQNRQIWPEGKWVNKSMHHCCLRAQLMFTFLLQFSANQKKRLDVVFLFSRIIFTHFGYSITLSKLVLHNMRCDWIIRLIAPAEISCSWQGFPHQQHDSHLLVGSTG